MINSYTTSDIPIRFEFDFENYVFDHVKFITVDSDFYISGFSKYPKLDEENNIWVGVDDESPLLISEPNYDVQLISLINWKTFLFEKRRMVENFVVWGAQFKFDLDELREFSIRNPFLKEELVVEDNFKFYLSTIRTQAFNENINHLCKIEIGHFRKNIWAHE